jgi:uncharacterized protein (TIGR03084 family)
MDDTLVDDLAAEQAALDSLVSKMDQPSWDLPTPAEGWTVRHQIAHLAFSDELALASLNGDGETRFRALTDPQHAEEVRVVLTNPGQNRTGPEVLAWWRAVRNREIALFRTTPASARLPWGPAYLAATSLCTARLMETWAHSLDCLTALGIDAHDTDRLRHVCHITYRAIPHAFKSAKTAMPGSLDELMVEVTSPSGDRWRYGRMSATQRITGSASEFARVGVRRMSRAEASTLAAEGPFADAALDILKAYL